MIFAVVVDMNNSDEKEMKLKNPDEWNVKDLKINPRSEKLKLKETGTFMHDNQPLETKRDFRRRERKKSLKQAYIHR